MGSALLPDPPDEVDDCVDDPPLADDELGDGVDAEDVASSAWVRSDVRFCPDALVDDSLGTEGAPVGLPEVFSEPGS